MLTGFILTFFLEYIKVKEKDTIEVFHEQLEKLPDLSRDELKRLASRIKEYNRNEK